MKGVEIRKPDQLQSVAALIIPGGESTTMAKLAELHNLVCVCGLLSRFLLYVHRNGALFVIKDMVRYDFCEF